MANHRLLLLGLLKAQRRHGYQIMDFVDRNLANLTSLKKATAYYELRRMATEELVTVRVEQEETRPPRRVYSLTESGEAAFLQLLRESLQESDPLDSGGVTGLMFLDWLDPAESIALLRVKIAGLRQHLEAYRRAPSHRAHSAVDLAINHMVARLSTEITWYEELVQQLVTRSGAEQHEEAEAAQARAASWDTCETKGVR